jgi:hypothetical protein
MDDGMIDLMAGDARLRRRLEAYAEARLSPDRSTSSRLRARVLAHAHRRADLARADAALTVVSAVPGSGPAPAQHRATHRWGPVGRLVLAASIAALTLALVGGGTVAARAGGPLYDVRVWVESVTLPSEPSARAVAELARLAERLREADAALAAGDARAAAAALGAYERIMEEASEAVFVSNDAVAVAALETGVGRNVEVLRALLGRVPATASEAIGRAIERAVERSGSTIDRIDRVDKPRPNSGGAPPDADPTDQPTADPTRTPKPKPEPTPRRETDPTSKPTKTPAAEPTKTAKPEETDKPPRSEPRRSPGPGNGNGGD